MASSTSTSSSTLASLPLRLLPLQLTPSGRPVLLPGEAERLIQDKADLVFVPTEEEKEQEERREERARGRDDEGEKKVNTFPRTLEDGVLRVTTHRLLWVDTRAAPSSGSSCSLPLQSVRKVELRATRLWSSAKARVIVPCERASGKLLLASSSSFSSSSSFTREIKVVAPGQQAIHAALQASLNAREWEKSSSGNTDAEVEAGEARTATTTANVDDDAAVAAVVQMGFSASDAVSALRATGSRDPQEAALWLLEQGEQEEPKKEEEKEKALLAQSLASSVGVGGLLRREAASAAAADAALESAFSDLGALMKAAAEMVELAKRYREESKARDERRRKEERAEESGGGAGGGGASEKSSSISETEASAADFEDELALLGVIASPVTRAATAASSDPTATSSSSKFSLGSSSKRSSSSSAPQHLSLFIRELSAELSDFCQPLVAAAGGVLPLPDVYCLYNRARGSELAAPLDVLAAAEAWSSLFGEGRAPLRLRRFGEKGGVLAVAAADQDDGAVCLLLAALARGEQEEHEKEKEKEKSNNPTLAAARARLLPSPCILGLGRALTPSDVAAAMRVPLPVAAAHLATAEAAGVLCRDDGEEGVRHFWNFFNDDDAKVSSSSVGAE